MNKNYYILYEYTTYPIWKSSKIIAKNKNPEILKKQTKGKGNKFFINHSTGGTRFDKRIGEGWIKMDNQI